MAAGGRRESGKRVCGMRGRDERKGERKKETAGRVLDAVASGRGIERRQGKRGKDGCTNGEYEERVIEGGGEKEEARQ